MSWPSQDCAGNVCLNTTKNTTHNKFPEAGTFWHMHYVQHYTVTTTLLMQSMHIQNNISHLNILCY